PAWMRRCAARSRAPPRGSSSNAPNPSSWPTPWTGSSPPPEPPPSRWRRCAHGSDSTSDRRRARSPSPAVSSGASRSGRCCSRTGRCCWPTNPDTDWIAPPRAPSTRSCGRPPATGTAWWSPPTICGPWRRPTRSSGSPRGGGTAPGPRARPAAAAPAPPPRSAVAADPRIRERPWLARRNPTVLLGLLTALSIACIALTDPAPLAVLYVLLAAGAMLGCRLGPVRMLRAQLPFLAFAVGVLSVNVLSRPGHEPWPELPVRITQEGIVLGAALALRALVIGLGAVVVTRATDPR